MRRFRRALAWSCTRQRPLAVALTLMFLALAAPSVLAQPEEAPAQGQTSEQPGARQPLSAAPSPAAKLPESRSPGRQPASILPQDLSPWGMFLSADIVVKAVMIGLALASVVTWTVWLAKSLELLAATRNLKRALAGLDSARSLNEAALHIGQAKGDVSVLVRAALSEIELSRGRSAEGVKERIASRFDRIEAGASRRMTRGTGLLATIGSTGPFVGLFGTVWGIMNSFVGISKAQTTNLAVVAPGIAEALLATAVGLVAAIPAVVIYNLFARWIAGYRSLLSDASAAVLRLVSRDLDGVRHRQAAE